MDGHPDYSTDSSLGPSTSNRSGSGVQVGRISATEFFRDSVSQGTHCRGSPALALSCCHPSMWLMAGVQVAAMPSLQGNCRSAVVAWRLEKPCCAYWGRQEGGPLLLGLGLGSDDELRRRGRHGLVGGRSVLLVCRAVLDGAVLLMLLGSLVTSTHSHAADLSRLDAAADGGTSNARCHAEGHL